MRVAVLGCGYWGMKHVRVLQQQADVDEVVGVDPDPQRRASVSEMFPGVVTGERLEDVLDTVEAVVVATPPSSHAEVARAAICAGKHVLVEKPMATTVADAQMLVETAALRRVTLMVGHTFIYNPAVEALRELVTSGELGTIHYIDCARLNLGLYQRDINVVWDLAPHDIAIVNHILDSAPAAVDAWASRHAHHFLEDVAYVRLRFDDPEVFVNIHVSWLDPSKVRRVTVVGSRKMAVYNDLADEERLRVYDKYVVEVPNAGDGQPPISYRYGGITSPYIQMQEPLAREVRHFLDCAATGAVPRTPGEDGLAVVAVLEAIERSRETRHEVVLEPSQRREAFVSG